VSSDSDILAPAGAPGEAGASGADPRAQGGVEPDSPPTRRLFLQLVALVVVLIGALIGLWQFFKLDTAAEIYRKELSVPNRELLELTARDEGRLSDYDLLDEKKGVYQIPVRRAMQMLVADPSLLAPVPVGK
jgi:hypothetical protein